MTKILIADDVSEHRYLLASMLKGSGYEVVSAQNGAEALELALTSPPDLIVTDILMPVMDGFELCRRWKTDDRLKAVPFLFYTATYTGPKDERFALSLGAERFVVKPQKPEMLMQVVREVLEGARRGHPAVSPAPVGGETEALRQHNEALLRKLEKKLMQLQGEMAVRERAEAALRESQARLLEAHRLAHIGIWYWDADTDTVSWSEELYRMAGLDPGQPAPRFAEHDRVFLPESWQRLQAAIHQALQTAEPYQLELELERPDGTRRWVHCHGGAKRDGSGRVVGLHGMLQDITERRQAEDRLRFSNLVLVTQMEASIDGVLVVDGAGTILHFNHRCVEMWSISEEAIASSSYERVLGTMLEKVKDPDAFVARVKQLSESRRETGRDEIDLADGRTFDTHSAPMFADGEFFGRVWCFRDITERKQAEEAHRKLEEQLRASQKLEAIGGLAGGIAHDFNNLLSVVLSYTGFAVDSLDVDDPLRADLVEVNNAANRAAALTRQLLAFGRKQLLMPEPLDLGAVATNLQKMLDRVIGEDIELVLSLAPDLAWTLADPSQIEQVIMNLVVNARDAMPDGGKLIIETANVQMDEERASRHVGMKPGPYVLLAVSDTGCGMDDQTQARIFEPFFTTKMGKGSGLGLPTVYGIIKQSGGYMAVESEPGEGTIFKIYFPVAEVIGVLGQKVLPPSALPRGTETVLVVEDEDAVRAVAERILAAAGYKVLTAANGAEALLTGETHEGEIHLVMTDIVMPQMNGIAFAERLAAIRPGIKVLCTSGYTDTMLEQRGFPGARVDFISKPYDAAELTRKVREVLDNRTGDQNL